MPPAPITVVRGAFSIEDPWLSPAGADVQRLRKSSDGTAPRLSTTVTAYYDDQCLSVLFSAADDHVVATMTQHDDPLYDEDVVEVFLAPLTPSAYYEIELSPLGTIFDARIESPDGIRETMRADPAWDCERLFAAVRRVLETSGAATVDTLIRIPFRSLGRPVPAPGEIWRGNFYRIDRHPEGDEYSAWRPTMKDPPDFHVTASFGNLLFRS